MQHRFVLPLGVIGTLLLVHWVCLRIVYQRTYLCPLATETHQHMTLWWAPANESHTSRHLFDIWSLTHFLHGIIFFLLVTSLWHKCQRVQQFSHKFMGGRVFFCATVVILIEVIWEIIENTPWIGKAYGATQFYKGDSYGNSANDVLSMSVGFLFAELLQLNFALAVPILLACECIMLEVVRDSVLTSTVNLLLHLAMPQRTDWPSWYARFIQWQCEVHGTKDCHVRLLWKREVVV